MRIEKIEIENFRGFKGKHAVSFHPNLNVFVGVNGAGKSSVLDLIGIGIDNLLSNLMFDYYSYPFSFRAVGSNTKGYSSSISRIIYHEANPDQFGLSDFDDLVGDGEEVDQILNEKIFKLRHQFKRFQEIKDDKINIPIFRYFNFKDKDKREHNGFKIPNDFGMPPQYLAYVDVFNSVNKFEEFIKRFISDENEENRDKVSEDNLKHENPNPKNIRKGLNVFFQYLKGIKFEKLRGENTRSAFGDKANLCVNKNGVTFNMTELSEGEQMMILLVADIAQRLAIANPYLEDSLKDGKGIVLIDEIETHLHPEWQREVIPALTATFPNIQFFITTHSPQVLGSVDNESVIIIENFEFKKSPHTKGRDSNTILTDVLGSTTRDIKYEKAFEELYDLIDNPDKVVEAKAKLRQMMAELGSDDSEIERAKMHFEFLTEKPI